MHTQFSETSSIKSLTTLTSLAQIDALNSIGLYSLRDLAEFKPCRYAEILIGSLENGNIRDLNLSEYLDNAKVEELTEEELAGLGKLPIIDIKGIGEGYTEIFNTLFSIYTIEELAGFAAFKEAKAIIIHKINDTFYEKPSAPEELIPKLIGSTHTQVRFSNYIKEKEYIIENARLDFLAAEDEPTPEDEFIDAFIRSKFKFHLGYLALFKQKWVNAGTHLGEIIHSLALAPGESRNIAFVEWYSKQLSSRSEDTEASENLNSEFYQNRALNEVVSTTAKEHQMGRTEIDATTETTGESKTSGFGGGTAAGASGKADLTAITGFPLEVAGAGMATVAGSTGKSKVYSKSTTQGTLVSETSGERSVTGEVMQNIADSTVQNSSNVRSLMSTVVVEDTQSGGQNAQTRNITNYNHSHALTMQYFEVLQKYNTNTFTDKLTPVLYLPFNPIDFNIDIIRKYWPIFKFHLKQVFPEVKVNAYDTFIKDFNPANGAFDPSDNVRIDRIKINKYVSYSDGVRVNIISPMERNKDVKVLISGQDMNRFLDLKIFSDSYEYVNYYNVLRYQNKDIDTFNSKSSIEIDEVIKAKFLSNFKEVLKSQLIRYVGDKDKVEEGGLTSDDFNRIAIGRSRTKIQDQIRDSESNYSILNGEQTVYLRLNIDYDLVDKHGNTTSVTQTYDETLTFDELNVDNNDWSFDISTHIISQLETIADINASDVLEELESHFQTYKYGYTKYLLNYIEKEQIIDVIEHLGIITNSADIPLTQIIDPNPLGITENLLIFKLKEADNLYVGDIAETFTFSAIQKISGKKDVLEIMGTGTKKETSYQGKPAIHYSLVSESSDLGKQKTKYHLNIYVSSKATSDKKYPFYGQIKTTQIIGHQINTNNATIQGFANKAEGKTITLNFKLSIPIMRPNPNGDGPPIGEVQEIEASIKIDFDLKKQADSSIADIINDYIENLKEYEQKIKKKHVKNTVFLPSHGVFGEAILGLSNASEYINVSRFYNWQDSPIPNSAPNIADVSVNENYSKEISDSINPNVPVSVLNQISPQQMPGTSLNTALGAIQNGNMFRDMSKSAELNSTLSDLATLANNTAQLAGTLSGEAAANALNAAVELGKQVAGMVNTAMGTNVASPPATQTEKGAAKNALEEMPTNPDGTVSPTDNSIANGMGTPVNPTPEPSGGGQTGTGGGTNSGGGNGSNGGNGGTGTGGSSGGNTGNAPADSKADEQEVSGAFKLNIGLPQDTCYTTLNMMEIIENFIPDSVEEQFGEFMEQWKKTFTAEDDSDGFTLIPYVLKIPEISGKIKGVELSAKLNDDKTLKRMMYEGLNLVDELIDLQREVMYHFAFLKLGFRGPRASNYDGTWAEAEVIFKKIKGQSLQLDPGGKPCGSVTYFFGGELLEPDSTGLNFNRMNGAFALFSEESEFCNFNVSHSELVSSDTFKVSFNGEFEVIPTFANLIDKIQEYYSAKLRQIVRDRSDRDKIEATIIDMLVDMIDQDSYLDAFMTYMGFSRSTIVSTLTTLSALRSAGLDPVENFKDILKALLKTFASLDTIAVKLLSLSFDLIFLPYALIEPTWKQEVSIDVDVSYKDGFNGGWQAKPSGKIGEFPWADLTYNNSVGTKNIIAYHVTHPQGLLGMNNEKYLSDQDFTPLQ